MRVSVDGGEFYMLGPGDSVKVRRAERMLRMVTLKRQSALGVLCRKMQLLNPKTKG